MHANGLHRVSQITKSLDTHTIWRIQILRAFYFYFSGDSPSMRGKCVWVSSSSLQCMQMVCIRSEAVNKTTMIKDNQIKAKGSILYYLVYLLSNEETLCLENVLELSL